MQFYAAPMEGVTTFVWRNLQYKMFPEGLDKYFTPFVTLNRDLEFKKRDLRDVLPKNNTTAAAGRLIPQVLTSDSARLIHAGHIFRSMGYEEINLNLGCPMGTVTAKGKGSALLRDLSALAGFLDTAVPALHREGIRLSVKTRLGYDNLDHAVGLIKLFLQYNLSEIIIHPRIRIDLYKGPVRRAAFTAVLSSINAPSTETHSVQPKNDDRTLNNMHPLSKIAYNGDLFTVADIKNFEAAFSTVGTVMLGRGLISNPAIVREYLTGRHISKEEIKEFTTRLFEDYHVVMPEDNNVINKMKEIWKSMADLFSECKDRDRALRDVLKARNRVEYNDAVRRMLAQEIAL